MRDALFAAYINPRTAQAYVSQGYVLDLVSLTPIGRLPAFCLLGADDEQGRIYGRIGGELLILDEAGGFAVHAWPTEPEPLPAAPISQIYATADNNIDERTIFLRMEDGRVYRTMDDGETWMRIQGGLPTHESGEMTLSLSPNFAEDRTLFAAGFRDESTGEGVLCSTNAGLTWQPLWDGLTHLRVYDVRISPSYAEDGTVYALARYNRLSPWEEGVSLHTSLDSGLNWTLTMTATDTIELETRLFEQAPALARAPIPLRIVDFGTIIEMRDDEGKWRGVDLEQKPGERILAIVPSPHHAIDNTYYALGDFSIWRTMDSGRTWGRWRDSRLAGRHAENALTSLAIMPASPDGSYQLLVGTRAGEFWILSPTLTSTTATQAPAAETAGRNSPSLPTTAAPATDSVESTEDPLTSAPPSDRFVPVGALASVWEASAETRTALGWAMTESAMSVPAALQIFERGSMIWDGGSATIIVLHDDGTWQRFNDTFEEGEPESDATLSPPGGGYQPIRGFGKLWRNEVAVRDSLGWALDEERGYRAFVHEFDEGALFSTPAGTRIFVRQGVDHGIWR